MLNISYSLLNTVLNMKNGMAVWVLFCPIVVENPIVLGDHLCFEFD